MSTCCSKVGENVVSEGVAFSGCDMVEKACCAGSSCRSKGHIYLELLGKQIIRRWVLITMSLYVDRFGMNKTYIARSCM